MKIGDKTLINLKLGVYFLVLICFSFFVSAFNGGVFRSFDPVIFYESFHGWIDFILAFLVFYGVAKFSFAKRFEGSANFIIAGISFALSFALILWLERTGSSLFNLGPVALLIFLIALLWALAGILESWTYNKFTAFVLSYVLVYFVTTTFLGFKEMLEIYLYNYIIYFEAIFWIGLIFVILSFLFRRKRGEIKNV